MRAKRPILCVSRLLPVAGCLLLLAGCSGGPSLVTVRGKLTNGGKPLIPDHKGGVNINFAPVPPIGKTYPGMYNPDDDTYEVTGDGKGIPEGKYKVAISLMSISPTPELDAINKKYGFDKTPIEVEVKGPAANIDIDLSKYK